ncbi:hypothetical protein RGC55_07285, partial [Helicobacter pylori]|nr:hypothetical protein [Helicobacter pylori]
MQKKKAKNPQPNLFSILDNGGIATNNPIEESDKANEIQEPLHNEQQNSNANNNNTIKNTIDTNTSNNIIQNNDNNHPNL